MKSNSLSGMKTGGTSAVRSIRVQVLTGAAVIVWSLGIGVGFLYSIQYETTPVETEVVRNRWPDQTECVLSAHRPTLVMFVHPRCPCSRASLSELATLMTHCQGKLDVQAVFLQPTGLSADWSKTGLWDSVARIPGVVPRLDIDGIEHQRFHASVSGEVFLYRPNGDLVLHGGITASRGHVGDNLGRAAIEEFLHHDVLPSGSMPVFGCELESRILSCSKSDTCAVGRIDP